MPRQPEGIPWWMKAKLAWILVLILAVCIAVLSWWAIVAADIKDKNFERLMADKKAAAEVLENTILEKQQNIEKLTQDVDLAREDLKRIQKKADREENLLKAKIEQLQQRKVIQKETTREEIEKIPAMKDLALSETIQEHIMEKDSDGQVTFKVDHGFCFNRLAANQIQVAFVMNEDLLARLKLETEELYAWKARHHSCQEHKKAALALVKSVEAKLTEYESSFNAAMQLNLNQDERLKAQATRIQKLERNIFWNKWKTTIGIGAGVAVGFLVGKELH